MSSAHRLSGRVLLRATLLAMLAALVVGSHVAQAAVQPARCGTGGLTKAQKARDTDRDRKPNWRDGDVDGDRRVNGRDRDVDGDRKTNGRDRDVDGDGLLNAVDRDVDGDGRANGADPDVDGDGVANGRDPDVDGDGLANAKDPDLDGDCMVNGRDRDSDGDGTEDPVDTDPYGGTQALRIASSPAERVPASFFGLVSNEALATTGAEQDAVLRDIRATGAGTLRAKLDWATVERSPGQYDFRGFDGVVLSAARAGVRVLPILFNPPAFHSSDAGAEGTAPPADNATFARFADAAVRRYGPAGTLWTEHPAEPALPVASWQVWNEPNFKAYWSPGPDAAAYTAMLRTVGTAVHVADPAAKVVMAGLPDSYSGISVVDYLEQMYAAGAKGTFDTLAVHPYARSAEQTLEILAGARAVLDRRGDRAIPIWATELGWGTGTSDAPYEVGEDAQAALITRVLSALAKDRAALNLEGVVYYAWKDAPPYAGGKDFWGLHTGLHRMDGSPKPALAAFTATATALGS